MNSEDAVTPNRHLVGVQGWLLVLCLYLMILVPVLALLGLYGVWQGASRSPTLQNALIFEAAFELGENAEDICEMRICVKHVALERVTIRVLRAASPKTVVVILVTFTNLAAER